MKFSLRLTQLAGLSLTLLALVSTAQGATHPIPSEAIDCEESAINYIVAIENAPYAQSGAPVISAADLELVRARGLGDGAEAYEILTFRNKTTGSKVRYRLKLYVQEIGGTCPLESFRVLN